MKSMVRELMVRYAAAIILIAIFATLGFLAAQYSFHRSEGAAEQINTAGRQRMLSQRIALTADDLADGDAQNTARLRAAIMTFDAAHRRLVHGEGAAPPSPALREVYFGADGADATVERFIAAASRVADKADRGALSREDPDLQMVWEMSDGPLLDQLEMAVAAYEADADKALRRFQILELVVWLSLLTLLAAEVLLIFAPAMRRLQRNTEEVAAAREADRRKTEWLELTQRIARVGHWFFDLKTGEVFWSDEAYRIHGVSKANFTPSYGNATAFYHPDDQADIEAEIARARAAGGGFSFEKRLVLASGDVRWVAIKGQCRLHEGGEVVALFGIIQDITERVERNAATREMKERYDLALSSAAVGVWDIDLNTREHRWSGLISEILGLPESAPAFTRGDFRDRLHPDDAETMRTMIAEEQWRGGPYDLTCRLRHEDGHYVDLYLRGAPVFDQDGAAQRLSGSFVDVTEERAAETVREELWSALTEQGVGSQLKLQSILERVTDYLGMRFGLISRIEGDVYTVRYAATPEGEITPGDVFPLGQTYCVHVLKAEASLAFHHVGESEIREHPCYQAFGLESYIGAPLIVEGRRFGTINFSSPERRDRPFSKTDRQLVQLLAQWVGYEIGRAQNLASLQESEERFALSAQGSGVGIWDWRDVGSDEEVWTDHFYRLLGYEPGEIPANLSTFQNLLHPDDHERTLSAVQNHLNHREPFHVEYRLRCKDGVYRWFLGSGQAVWDADGQPRRMIGSIRDIQKRKAAEGLKNEFVSTVSHELRTPMTSIMGAIGLVKSGKFGQLNPQGGKLLDIAFTNGERLVRLINDILDVEKIEAGKIQFAKRDCALAELIRDAIAQNERFAAEHNAEIAFVDNAQGAHVHVDPDRMMQVLTNLLSNAAKFTAEEGRITVTASRRQGRVEIAVRDNGPGIPPDHLDRIFEKFVQVDGRDSRSKDGTGLGLAITKAIVDAHAGTLTVQSTLGEGATFSVALDEAQSGADDPGQGVPGYHPVPHEGRPCVLHVEDDHDTAAVLRHLLDDVADVTVAETAGEAGAMMRDRPFDLVVLDLKLPDGRGESLLEEMSRRDAPPPVILYASEAPDAAPPPFVVAAYVKSQVSHEALRRSVISALGMAEPETALAAGAGSR